MSSRRKLVKETTMITQIIFDSLKRNWGKKYHSRLPGRKDIFISKANLSLSINLEVAHMNDGEFDIYACIDQLYDESAVMNVYLFHDHKTKHNLQDLYYELSGVVRHELEHVMQIAYTDNQYKKEFAKRYKLFGQNETFDNWSCMELEMIKRSKDGNFLDYMCNVNELPAFCNGFYEQAHLSNVPVHDIINIYLSNCIKLGRLTDSDVVICKKWLFTWLNNVFPLNTKIQLPA